MNYTFTVTGEEANIIAAALAEMPFKVASPLIQKLQMQAQQQVANSTEADQAAEQVEK